MVEETALRLVALTASGWAARMVVLTAGSMVAMLGMLMVS